MALDADVPTVAILLRRNYFGFWRNSRRCRRHWNL